MANIKVFISSVQSEFSTERLQLFNYIKQDVLLGQYFEPFIFEKLPAAEETPQQAYLKEASECDIYIGLFGIKYGVEDENGLSPTEKEYQAATLHHANRLIYVLQTSLQREKREKDLIAKVQEDVIRKKFIDYEELRTAVYNSLISYLSQKGFIRVLPFDASPHFSASYADIDQEQVRKFVERAKEKRNFKIPFSDGIPAVFSAIHVLTETGDLTNAALLLFGKDPQKFFLTSEVKCAQFYGNIVEKPIRNFQVYKGTLFDLIDSSVGFIMSRIDASVGTRENSNDVKVEYEIPESVVSEAITNAIAHRDYSSNASIQVMLFRDRIEIWNPGRLPYGLTPDKLTRLHSSYPTNPVIAHPLFLAGNIEHLGTGTTDIIRDCISAGLSTPEFHQEEDFRIVIWRRGYSSDPKESAPESCVKVTEFDQKVTELDQKVTEFNQKVTELTEKSNSALSYKLTSKQKLVLEFCADIPRSSQEIISYVGVKYQTKTFTQYVTKLIGYGLLRPTKPQSKDPNIKYISTHSIS